MSDFENFLVAPNAINAHLRVYRKQGYLSELQVQSELITRVKDLQQSDPELQAIVTKLDSKANVEFSLNSNGLLYFRDRVCVPNNEELKRDILQEAHQSPFSVHPGSVKMYKDLKSLYWWPGMKAAITRFCVPMLDLLKG